MNMPQTPPEGSYTVLPHRLPPIPSFGEDDSLDSIISELSLRVLDNVVKILIV